MSDSLARSTGVVYQRAWRQIVYAALVTTGAWVGGRLFGLAGVAWGVLAAITANFLLMAQLSLHVTQMRWREFVVAHAPSVALTAVVTPTVWLAASALRLWHASPFVIVAVVAALFAVMSMLLIWLVPAAFLGADGEWMLRALRKFVTRREQLGSRDSTVPPYAAVAHSERQA
jgi:hypothetical protein